MIVHDASLIWHVKDFFGFRTFTPFEETLLKELQNRLCEENSLALRSQIKRFIRCGRLLKAIPYRVGSYGYTELYMRKNDSTFSPFNMDEEIKVIASSLVIFDGGEIKVTFTQFEKRLFMIKYTGNKKTYYPPRKKYKLTKFEVFI